MSAASEAFPPGEGGAKPTRTDLFICLALILATLAVYVQVRHFEFLNFDDLEYVAQNPHVAASFSAEGLKWALKAGTEGYWFPLTRLSHMLDYKLFGAWAGGHHLTNVILHTLASLLAFRFLGRATGDRWPSAFVAFVFALHPLHVESVAWVAERKDVLCAVFWFLTLWAWVRYAERPTGRRYLLSLLLFSLGLMAKPIIITLPFVLLLLDAWPLRRQFSGRLILEKLPFLALSAADAAVTYLTQNAVGAVSPGGHFPLGLRISNSLITWVIFIGKAFWPVDMAVIYPYPASIPLWQAVLAALVLAGASVLAVRRFRDYPWVAVGWFWYMGTLVPVVGLVQAGLAARTNHAMYQPLTGLAIVVAWSGAALLRGRPQLRPYSYALAGLCCLSMAAITRVEAARWQNGEMLFRHATEITTGNYAAYEHLGDALAQIPGRHTEAIAAFRKEVSLYPERAESHSNLGAVLAATGRWQEATAELEMAVAIKPRYARAHYNLANALAKSPGRLSDAMQEFRTAFRLDPEYAEAHGNLATALLAVGRVPEAISELQTALRIDPRYVDAHSNLGVTLAQMPGRSEEGLAHLREALRLRPDDVVHNNMGIALARVPDQTFEALFEFREAIRINPGNAAALSNLGLMLAQLPGREGEAIACLEAAMRIKSDPALQTALHGLRARSGQIP